MKKIAATHIIPLLLFCAFALAGQGIHAKTSGENPDSIQTEKPKALSRRMRIPLEPDTLAINQANQENLKSLESPVDTASLIVRKDSIPEIYKKTWVPNPTKAVWLAALFPGAGQIYNRKYWKLPIIYGGFVGCVYALTWNGQMYSDYSQAYLDIMDNNPNTNSFMDFLPEGYDISDRMDFYKESFRKKKDFYRRYRDLSIFCFIGVYLISIIDAYVDAELSDFDITKDLGMKIEPAIINNSRGDNSIGLQCCIKF